MNNRAASGKRDAKNTLLSKKSTLAKRWPCYAGSIIRTVFIIGFSYLFLFPIFYMLVTAVQDPALLDPSVMWIPKGISLLGFKGAVTSLRLSQSMPLTAVNTLFSTLASLVSCSMVGYGFARFKFPFKNLAFALVLLTIIVPPQALIMSNYLNFFFFDFGGILSLFGIQINLLNTPWVFVLPAMFASGLRGGLFIFIFRQFFQGLPKELEEASKIDGCGPFRTYTQIMVRLALPAFMTVLLFSLIWHWNDFYNSAIYFTGEIKPVPVMLSNLSIAIKQDGIASTTFITESRMFIQAGILLSIMPLLVIYLLTQRFFTESIAKSGIVG